MSLILFAWFCDVTICLLNQRIAFACLCSFVFMALFLCSCYARLLGLLVYMPTNSDSNNRILRNIYTWCTLRYPFYALPFPLLVLLKASSNTFNTSSVRLQACPVVVLPYAYAGWRISSAMNALSRWGPSAIFAATFTSVLCREEVDLWFDLVFETLLTWEEFLGGGIRLLPTYSITEPSTAVFE